MDLSKWKTLFIKEEESGQATKPVSFPTSPVETQVKDTFVNLEASNKHFNSVVDLYTRGLDSLNLPGYDFYEFYNAISSVPSANQQTYQMAFQMAMAMDKSITVATLTQNADYYLSKINDVYQDYMRQGQSKITAVTNNLNSEKQQLGNEVNGLNAQIQSLRTQITDLENQLARGQKALGEIELKYKPQEQEIKEKLLANEKAKSLIESKINQVKNNINQYLK